MINADVTDSFILIRDSVVFPVHVSDDLRDHFYFYFEALLSFIYFFIYFTSRKQLMDKTNNDKKKSVCHIGFLVDTTA